MPKLKSHRGAMKRFKVTAKGKVKRSKAFASHLKLKKSSKRKRQLRRPAFVGGSDAKKIKSLLT
ncbi:MAG TPA: 50S ribosomal protein L35 [Candidatus Aerophobetes bacterium]|uniref:Large ribosomal subunit protein bL35 n=1 Tax=Aerophobetes bacterium TaxID=2030807 RepID=A0A7V5LZV8_UNCAE|nr:50S ribosomal protein L35 [Candidatus Aerophobetes bacterium]